ncbi:MAG: hypothetical protein ACR2HM_05380 [Acidimicrobiales bacterium]
MDAATRTLARVAPGPGPGRYGKIGDMVATVHVAVTTALRRADRGIGPSTRGASDPIGGPAWR